jgi:hypothetical protein
MDWEPLYAAFECQPVQASPIQRGSAALAEIGFEHDVSAERAVDLLVDCESIQSSPTFNWFQEMVLGSPAFERIYDKACQINTASYLEKYDRKLLEPVWAERVVCWAGQAENGAAIMTSRPSNGPDGFAQEPDGQLGAELVGLGELSLVGNGEMRWLAEQLDVTVAEVKKPAAAHALAALLAASGMSVPQSLEVLAGGLDVLGREDFAYLDGSTVTVVEDTISGMLAVRAAADVLEKMDVRITLRNVGVATDAAKVAALEGMGALVYSDVNLALEVVLTTDGHR